MANTTVDSKTLFLSNIESSWLKEILTLCIIVPMGLIGTVLNLISLSIFLKKSIRKIALFKYLIIISVINSILAFSLIFCFLCSFYIFRVPDTIIFSFRRSLAPSQIFLLKTPPRIFFLCLSVCHMLNIVYLA
jgi:hypothetical protein